MAPKPAQGWLIAFVMLAVSVWALWSVLGRGYRIQVLGAYLMTYVAWRLARRLRARLRRKSPALVETAM